WRVIRIWAVVEGKQGADVARWQRMPLRPMRPGNKGQAALRHNSPGRGVRSQVAGGATAPAAVTPARRRMSPGTFSTFQQRFGLKPTATNARRYTAIVRRTSPIAQAISADS